MTPKSARIDATLMRCLVDAERACAISRSESAGRDPTLSGATTDISSGCVLTIDMKAPDTSGETRSWG